ncbi:hypothetical protein BC008_19380 [Mastigocoleus testarum BC008]|uniref:Uncharacterized protein n=1 Tax=Mastigocoleus testarum BC008 TaxID=371196 RepID=A0A0V7ZK37_9CYAN|nr:hypothetical protein BC008_19380 [Mastigocoleus testarum BC008]
MDDFSHKCNILSITYYSLRRRQYITPTTSKYGGDLPVTNYQLPITSYQLPITNYPLPVTNYQLPITNYQLPITHYPFTDESK